jgi:competence ComEA-like helix-hairpin-helix protein
MQHSTRLLATCVTGLMLATIGLRLARPLHDEQLPLPRDTGFRINLNTADAAELTLLPGIGRPLAQRIIEHRTRIAPFASVDQLDDVHGIGATTVRRVRAWCEVE